VIALPALLAPLLARPAILGLLALAGVAGWQWVRAELAGAARDKAKAEVALVRQDLARQSAAVAAWQVKADAQAQQVASAWQAAAESRRRHAVALRRLSAAEVPAGCEGAMQWLTEQAGLLSEGWR
jgi:hypothetical protein